MTSWMLTVPTEQRVRFEAIGAALPAHKVTTKELMASTRHHTKIDLERLTGIREHRVCDPGESSLSLALGAAHDCLAHSRYQANQLDAIVSTSISRYVDDVAHRFEPPLSVTIKSSLHATRALTFDISNACAGMLTGVFLLANLIRKGTIQRGMVVSGERITGLGTNAARHIRNILSLQLASLTLGDAGAAVIVERSHESEGGILLAGFTTLAEHSRLCVGVPALHHPGAQMYTRARKIHEVAMADAPPLLEEILARAGLHLADIDWLIPHQTSVRAIKSGEKILAERLHERPGHFVITVDEYGNTASTTLFLALHKYLDEGRFRRGDKILLLSVASGLEVGIVVFEMDKLEATHGHLH